MGSDPKRKGGYNDRYAKWQQDVAAMKAPIATGPTPTAAQMKVPGEPAPTVTPAGMIQDPNIPWKPPPAPTLRPLYGAQATAGPGIPPPLITPPPPRQNFLWGMQDRYNQQHPSRRTGSGSDRGGYTSSGRNGGAYSGKSSGMY